MQEDVADVAPDDASSLEVIRSSENEYDVGQESGLPTPSRGPSQGEEEEEATTAAIKYPEFSDSSTVAQGGSAYRGGHIGRNRGKRDQRDDKFKQFSLRNSQEMATSMKRRV